MDPLNQPRNPLPPVAPATFPTDNATLAKQKLAREMEVAKEKTFTVGPDGVRVGGYFGRILREDGFLNGMIGQYVGNAELMPDPNYAAFEPTEWKRLTEGIPDQYHPELYAAHSAAHGSYIRDRLLTHIREQTDLGDLSTAGQVGRFAAGVVSPENLGLGLGASVLGRTVGGFRGFLSGTASGGAANAGFEKLTQHYNFENRPEDVLGAFLMGAAFSAPFAYLSSREMAPLRTAAHTEGQQLLALPAPVKRPLLGSPLETIEAPRQLTGPAGPGPKLITDSNVIEGEFRRVSEVPGPSLETIIAPQRQALPGGQKLLGLDSTIEGEFRTVSRAAGDMHATPAEVKAHVENSKLDALMASVDKQLAMAEKVREGKRLEAAQVIKDAKAKAAAEKKAANAVKRADELLAKVDAGSVPAFVTKGLTKVANDLGIKVEKNHTPNDVIAAIKAQRQPPTPEPVKETVPDAAGPAPVAEPPKVAAPEPKVAPEAVDPIGSEVIFRDHEGLPDSGVVVAVNGKGSFKIDTYPSLGEGLKPSSGQRYIWRKPEDLDPASAHYKDPEGLDDYVAFDSTEGWKC